MTAPALLAERALREPGGVALRAERLGLYRERTWGELAELAGRAALGLSALGAGRSARVAFVCDAGEDALVCALAAQALGAVACPVAPAAPDDELAARLRGWGADVVVAGDVECEERVFALEGALPANGHVVALDRASPADASDLRRVPFDAVLARGAAQLSAAGGRGVTAFERLAQGLDADAPAVARPGPSGGETLSHAEQLEEAAALVRRYPVLGRPGHRTVAYLPLSDPLGLAAALTLPLVSGVVPHFGETPEALPRTLFDVAPTVWLTWTGHLQRLASQVLQGLASTGAVKASACAWAMALGRRSLGERAGGLPGGALYRAARWLVLRPLLNKLGFDRLELVVARGDPLDGEAAALWQVCGLPVVNV